MVEHCLLRALWRPRCHACKGSESHGLGFRGFIGLGSRGLELRSDGHPIVVTLNSAFVTRKTVSAWGFRPRRYFSLSHASLQPSGAAGIQVPRIISILVVDAG